MTAPLGITKNNSTKRLRAEKSLKEACKMIEISQNQAPIVEVGSQYLPSNSSQFGSVLQDIATQWPQGAVIVFRGFARNWSFVEPSIDYLKTSTNQKKHYVASPLPNSQTVPLTSNNGMLTTTKMKIADFLAAQKLGSAYLLSEELPFKNLDDTKNLNEVVSWLRDYLTKNYVDEIDSSKWTHQFFITKGQLETELHYDNYYNMFTCIHGSRVWYLAPPIVTSQIMNLNSNYSQWNPAKREMQKGVKDSRISKLMNKYEFLQVELLPGDVLFVPPTWAHLVQAKPDKGTGLSVAMNTFFLEQDTVGKLEKLRKVFQDDIGFKVTTGSDLEWTNPDNRRFFEWLYNDHKNSIDSFRPRNHPFFTIGWTQNPHQDTRYTSFRQDSMEDISNDLKRSF